jgi:hypothetical protein
VILKSIEEFNLIVGKFGFLLYIVCITTESSADSKVTSSEKLAFKSPENSLFSYHHKRLERVPVGIIFV